MSLRHAARLFVPFVLVAGAASLGGCRVHHYETVYAAPADAPERVHVRVEMARVRGERVSVTTRVLNESDRPMLVSREDLGLRLPDGTVLPSSARKNTRPVVIRPGESKVVKVGFRAPRGSNVSASKLVFAGVQFGSGGAQDLGEVALSRRSSTFHLGGEAPATAEGAEEAVVPTDEPEEAGELDDEEEDVTSPELEDDGSWQVGGG